MHRHYTIVQLFTTQNFRNMQNHVCVPTDLCYLLSLHRYLNTELINSALRNLFLRYYSHTYAAVYKISICKLLRQPNYSFRHNAPKIQQRFHLYSNDGDFPHTSETVCCIWKFSNFVATFRRSHKLLQKHSRS